MSHTNNGYYYSAVEPEVDEIFKRAEIVEMEQGNLFSVPTDLDSNGDWKLVYGETNHIGLTKKTPYWCIYDDDENDVILILNDKEYSYVNDYDSSLLDEEGWLIPIIFTNERNYNSVMESMKEFCEAV